jgi:hypothetical protein
MTISYTRERRRLPPLLSNWCKAGLKTPPIWNTRLRQWRAAPALVLTPDTTTAVHRDLVIALAARHGLPAVYFARYWVRAGGLMSYGNDRISDWRQVASYVDRILRGERTIDLPVQAPVRYETVQNGEGARHFHPGNAPCHCRGGD